MSCDTLAFVLYSRAGEGLQMFHLLQKHELFLDPSKPGSEPDGLLQVRITATAKIKEMHCSISRCDMCSQVLMMDVEI